MKQGDGRATNAVFRRLQASPDGSHWRTVGESLAGKDTTLEDFTKQAKAWLADKTDIKTRSLQYADWREVFRYFKSQTEES